MMQLTLDILSIIALLVGLFLMLVGAIGIVRFPDTFHRLHAASKCSTLGLASLLIGAVCHIDNLGVLIQSILVIGFAFVATPVGTHILAKAAVRAGVTKWERTCSDDYQDDRREREGSEANR